MFACMCVYHMHTWPAEDKEGAGSPGTGLKVVSHHVVAGNETWKNN